MYVAHWSKSFITLQHYGMGQRLLCSSTVWFPHIFMLMQHMFFLLHSVNLGRRVSLEHVHGCKVCYRHLSPCQTTVFNCFVLLLWVSSSIICWYSVYGKKCIMNFYWLGLDRFAQQQCKMKLLKTELLIINSSIWSVSQNEIVSDFLGVTCFTQIKKSSVNFSILHS